MKISADKTYPVFDRDGILKSARKGSELIQSYNRKFFYPGVNKDTVIKEYGGRGDRIDLFCKEKNLLISMGMDSADKIRNQLLEQGISKTAAENLLRDIEKAIPENYRSVFNYTAETSDVVYADIPNIGEYLAQSQLSQTVIGKAQCVGEIPQGKGSMCCVLDNNTNKFTVIPQMSRHEAAIALSQMGYSELAASEIAERITRSYKDNENVNEKKRGTELKYFDGFNAELDDLMYASAGNSVIIVREGSENYEYMKIEKNMPPDEIKKALSAEFNIRDELSAAVILDALAQEKMISPFESVKVGDAEISKISDNIVRVSSDVDSAVMYAADIDRSRLERLFISDETINAIESTIERIRKNALKNKPVTLKGLRREAALLARIQARTLKREAREKTAPEGQAR